MICMNKILISLDNLDDEFRVGLAENFRKKLFDKARETLGTQKKLMKEIGYKSYSGILGLRRGYIARNNGRRKELIFLKVATVKKLSEITKTPMRKIELNIKEVKTYKKGIKIKFPIHASKELSLVIGHSFGDGHVNLRFFSYSNKNQNLLDEVTNSVQVAFSTDFEPRKSLEGKKRDVFRIVFPASIARLLLLIGGPKGNKTQQSLEIPNWIKNNSKEIKGAFIRALFDDEGCVAFRGKEGSQIFFNMTKSKKILDSHYEFIDSIKAMLKDFDIIPNKTWKSSESCSGNNVALAFGITGYNNFVNFMSNIGFTNTAKMKKLENIIKHIKKITYRKGECEKIILNELNQKSQNVHSLMQSTKRSYNCVRSHLIHLYKNNIVDKNRINKIVLWSIKNEIKQET